MSSTSVIFLGTDPDAAHLRHSSGEVQCGGSALQCASSWRGRRGGRRRWGCVWVNLFLLLVIILIFIVNHLKLLEVVLEGADWVVHVTLLQNQGVLWYKRERRGTNFQVHVLENSHTN